MKKFAYLLPTDVVDGHLSNQYNLRILRGRHDVAQAGLKDFGISTMTYNPVSCHRLKLYMETHATRHCPVSAQLADEMLHSPTWSEFSQGDVEPVTKALRMLLRDY